MSGKPNEQHFPKQVVIQLPYLIKNSSNIYFQSQNKIESRIQVTILLETIDHNRSTVLKRSVIDFCCVWREDGGFLLVLVHAHLFFSSDKPANPKWLFERLLDILLQHGYNVHCPRYFVIRNDDSAYRANVN